MASPFVVDASTTRLKLQDGNELLQPVGAYRDQIIIERGPLAGNRDSAPQQFELWDPATDVSQPLWQGPADKWDVAGEGAGPWLATIRGDRADGPRGARAGQVILRNLETGEVRPITSRDEAVDLASGLPSMSGTLVAWSDSVRQGPFPVETRVHLYDLESGATSTLADVKSGSSESPPAETVGSPSVGGRRVAWQHSTTNAREAEIVILDLDSGDERAVTVENLSAFALSPDGAWLAWNEAEEDGFALNLQSGEKLQFAHDSRFIFRSQASVAWAPASDGGWAGAYDLDRHEVRLVAGGDHVTGVAGVLGGWFVWVSGTDPIDRYYYFAPYGPKEAGH